MHMRAMRGKGRPPAWTREQRERVVALRKEKRTQRAIAKEVFGDERYRGRVERILREEANSASQSRRVRELTEDELAAFDVEDVAVARELVARYERSLAESAGVPALAEIAWAGTSSPASLPVAHAPEVRLRHGPRSFPLVVVPAPAAGMAVLAPSCPRDWQRGPAVGRLARLCASIPVRASQAIVDRAV